MQWLALQYDEKNARNPSSILPLKHKRGPGRPKKLRRRETNEDPNHTKLREKNNQVPMQKMWENWSQSEEVQFVSSNY